MRRRGKPVALRFFSMQSAVIKTGGKQYRVEPGTMLRVERLDGDVGSTIEFNEVLLTTADDTVQIGRPLVEGVTVRAKIVAQGRAKKIIVFKKKRRKGYRRKQGHRQTITTVRVTEIA